MNEVQTEHNCFLNGVQTYTIRNGVLLSLFFDAKLSCKCGCVFFWPLSLLTKKIS